MLKITSPQMRALERLKNNNDFEIFLEMLIDNFNQAKEHMIYCDTKELEIRKGTCMTYDTLIKTLKPEK